MSKKEVSVEEKGRFLIAAGNFRDVKSKRWYGGVDFLASDLIADEKVLVRLVEEPQNKSRFVGAEDVKGMLKVMRREGCAKGFLVGEKFTAAASQEMERSGIQQISDDYIPPVRPENISLKINECINSLCKTRCGVVPFKSSNCRDKLEDGLCRVKSISDDAHFHRERGWLDLLKNDLRQLLLLSNSIT